MNINEDEISFLRRRRKQLRLRQQDVADYLEITKSAICQYESYRATLSKKTISKYYEFIKISETIQK